MSNFLKNISLLILLFSLFSWTSSIAQNTDKEFIKVYQRINSQRIFIKNNKNIKEYYRDSLEVVEMQQLLKFYKNYLNKEHSLKGSAGFSFSGNENDINNLYRIGVIGRIKKGAYPNEFDFNLNVQTTIQNGTFQESLSDIDVSYDFHPLIPKVNSKNDGLWLENYVFIKRFNNNFLGIQQRYETGAGVIFNFYSKNHLTEKGKKNVKALQQIPQYDIYNGDLKRCLNECYLKKSVLGITESEIETIVNTRERYFRSNIKKESKLRLALLIGLYYELEEAFAQNIFYDGQQDSLISIPFKATNKLRWEIRPSIVWQPKSNYRFKIYPYFKLPFGNGYDIVSHDDLIDRRYDYFMDLITSLEILVEKNISINIHYRLLYDNTPKRLYLQNSLGNYVLFSGQKRNAQFGLSIHYNF